MSFISSTFSKNPLGKQRIRQKPLAPTLRQISIVFAFPFNSRHLASPLELDPSRILRQSLLNLFFLRFLTCFQG
ncbi:hypothetical protein J5N97_001363 [Dioscorea zingiberensis]|uniref:Uncharacterized protein n=1 Tax=Dioscorea zingiberensis TaxID=325984 RepID=A0A9D5BU52_9LILI|nr:hypothetical protein J5N97_001363 [Dioscorea zingiberensis]